MRIYLIGFMGSGKSTVGKKLAKSLAFEFIDLDHMIELKYKTMVSVLFEKYGENVFRVMERKSLTETAGMSNIIVATGGGTPCFFDNMKWMKSNGLTVYLKLTASSLQHRLQHSKKARPLVSGKSGPELTDFVKGLLAERESYYNDADWIIKGESLELTDLVSEIIKRIK